MYYLRRLLILSCKVYAYLNVRPFNLMIYGFTDVMKKACPFRYHHIGAQFGCHACCKVSHFNRVSQHVLSKTGSESQFPKQANEIRMKAVNSYFNSSAFPFFFNYAINFFLCFLHHLFDSRRVDSPVIYQFL